MSSNFFLISIALFLNFIIASSQVLDPLVLLENNNNIRLTFNIPLDIKETKVPIRLDYGNGSRQQDLVFINKVNLTGQIVQQYQNRLTVTPSLPERKVYLDLKAVSSDDAGMYRCYDGIDFNAIATCGQKLVIVRKPDKPTIQELTSALEGANLKLKCVTKSASLPPDHGLKSAILWRNDKNQIIGVPGTDKISMDADDHLEIRNIQRADKGLKLTCTSSDIANGINSPESDQSPIYEVKPEFKPTVSDIVLTPSVLGVDKISKKESEDLTYTCDTTCDPTCTVDWSFKSFSSSSFSPISLTDPKTLKKTVQRTDHGTYRCSATNKHGVATKDFDLEVLYITLPVLSINDKTEDNTRVPENQPARLQCVVDALPAPKISWKSTTQVLSTVNGQNPKESRDNVLHHIYTSEHLLNSVKCEDTGVYSCEVTNGVTTHEGRINMVVSCPPTSANIEGLRLEHDYVWEVQKVLTFSFVIKAFPEPNVIKVISEVINELPRVENLATDVSITKVSKYDGKDYLTKFTFTSVRLLDVKDIDRKFTMTFETSEFKKDLSFVIRPRGPPQPATNITAVEIKHNSIKLFWMAGFNGGEPQSFDVEYRHFSLDLNSNWNTATDKIKDPEMSGMWVEAVIQHLDASTDYQFRIKSTNSRGSVLSEIYRLRTADEPDEALSAGGIAGIVIAVIAVIVIVLIVLYVFLYRRKWGKQKETGESRKSMLPDRLTKVFIRPKTSNVKQEPNGISMSNDKPKHASIFKNKKLLNQKSKPKDLYPNRKNSEEESDSDHYNDEDDHSEAEDGDYINTELRKMEPDRDEYLNVEDYRRQTESKKNKDDLNYVSIDFKDIQKARDKKKKKNKTPSLETGPYSQIDFEKTQALRQKMLAEEMLADNQEHFENEPIVDTSAEDNDDRKRQPLELMGTAV